MRLKVNNVNFDIVNYIMPTHKLSFGTMRKTVTIADLHGYHNNPKKRKAIVEAIRMQQPHHIVIAGDHMNAATGRWHNDAVYGNFCDLVRQLSEIAPVVLSQGNHDINAIGSLQEEANQRFLDLANLNPGRIFPLINGRVVIDDFEIIGFTPSHDTMSDTKTQEHGVAHDKFMKEYEEKGVRPVGGDDVIVEHASHNPHLFTQSENGVGMGDLSKVDNTLTGHDHNAYVPSQKTRKNPDKFLDGKGYVEGPVIVDKNGKLILSSIRPLFRKLKSSARGQVMIDERAQKRLLQLRNGHYYVNTATKDNEVNWVQIPTIDAIRMIFKEHLKSVTVTGGVKKFSPIPRKDEPEITVTNYQGWGAMGNEEEMMHEEGKSARR